MSTPDQPSSPSGWGEAPRPPAYGQYGPGQYGAGQYGQGRYGQAPDGGTPGQQPAGAPNPYGPAATKPGIVPLRPLSLGEVYDGAFGAVRHNPAVLLGMVSVVVAVATVLATLLSRVAVPFLTGALSDAVARQPDLAPLEAEVPLFAELLALSGALTLTFLIAQPIAEGLITASVSQSVIGRKLAPGQVWARVRPRLATLVGWMVVRTLAVTVGVFALTFTVALLAGFAAAASGSIGLAVLVALVAGLACVALVLWLWVRFLLVVPALVLEGRPLLATVARAWRLTRQNYWRILGTVLLANVIASLAGQVVGYPLALVGFAVDEQTGGLWGTVVASVVASVIASVVLLVFTSGVVALVYTDVRMRREGLDVRLAEAAARAAQEPAPGASDGPTLPPTTGPGAQW